MCGVRHLVLLSLAGGLAFGADTLQLDGRREELLDGGYTFRKSYDTSGKRWVFRAFDGAGRLAHEFGNPAPTEMDPDLRQHLRIGLVKAVSGEADLVAIEVRTGGNHGRTFHWLVAVEPNLRVVLDTSGYYFDDLEVARDVDQDGDLEFSFRITTFDYFGTAFAYSPSVYAWFKYDRKSRRFLPANDSCFHETQKEIRAYESRLNSRRWDQKSHGDMLDLRQIVLNIVLAKLYAGRDQEAWHFLARHYRQPDRPQLRKGIMRRAESDPFFQALRRAAVH